MARKVYQLSNINLGIGWDANFCKPWQVADLQNVDVISDSNSIRLVGESSPYAINRREEWEIIDRSWLYFLSADGYFEELGVSDDFSLSKGIPSEMPHGTFKLPEYTVEVSGKDYTGKGLLTNNGVGQKRVLGAVSLINRADNFERNYTILATSSFLHLVKSPLINNTISGIINNGDWLGEWWIFEDQAYKHNGGKSALIRTFNKIIESFQFEFACRNWSAWSLKVKLEYQSKEYIRTKNKRKEDSINKVHTFSYKEDRNTLINKIAIQWWISWPLKISILPTDDFDGELFYNGLFDLGNISENPTNFSFYNGIRINYHKIKSSDRHPMVIVWNILYVGCGEKIEKFTINPSNDWSGNFQLVESEGIELWANLSIISLKEYGDRLVVYANNGKDGYQIITDGGISENTIVWKWVNFIAVGNDGLQDFVIASIGDRYAIYVVSWYNKKELFRSKSIPKNKKSKPIDELLFSFNSDVSHGVMGKFYCVWDNNIYSIENTTNGMILSRFSLEDWGKISFVEEDKNGITYGYKKDGVNYIQNLYLSESHWKLVDGYITLPTLSTHHEEWVLESVSFWAFLPNEESRIEIRAKVNEIDYFTYWVKNVSWNDFSHLRIRNQQGGWELEVVDKQISEWKWYISFRTKGDLGKIKNDGEVPELVDLTWKIVIWGENIEYRDHYIKVEEIKRNNQANGTKDLGYNISVDVRKINRKVWYFSKLSLKIKMSAWKTFESPKIYAPVLLYYT